jgi:hypothetical protein
MHSVCSKRKIKIGDYPVEGAGMKPEKMPACSRGKSNPEIMQCV